MVRYLTLQIIIQEEFKKLKRFFSKKLDFKYIKFPVKIREIQKFEKKNSKDISVFGYENKEKYPVYVSKKCFEEKHVDLLLIGEGEKNTMSLSMISKDSCLIIHYIAEKKHFCRYSLHAFITEETLKRHIKD